jgi:Spy/CpxP family protein refolding chaperone
VNSRALLVIATLLFSSVVLADQSYSASHGPRQPSIDQLATELNLTADQKTAVQKVFDQQRDKMRSMHEQAQSSGQRPSNDEMRERRATMDQELHDQLKPILTDEQMQKFETLQQQRRTHSGSRQRERPDESPLPPQE